MMSSWLGHLHFWPSLICMNLIFMPMMIQGLHGVQRRLWDGGETYAHAQSTLHLNDLMMWAAWIMGAFQIPFLVNFFWSIKKGRKVSENPWHATTLEWAAPSPPPHGNFAVQPQVYGGPYDYSVPGAEKDYSPQWEPGGRSYEPPGDAAEVPAE
jgi:cytochrome c oxidase subunit I